MFYVGLDIHNTRITICALNKTGQVVHRSQVRGIQETLAALKGLPDRFEVCYEASCGYGHSHDLLRPLAARVLVAHPGQLRLIFRSKNKNDRNDAERFGRRARPWPLDPRLGDAAQGPPRKETPTSPTSRSRAGPRPHPEVRHGAVRRRRCEWGQPHYLSWRPAPAGDAGWRFGKSRARLAPILTGGSSWMPDRSAQDFARNARS